MESNKTKNVVILGTIILILGLGYYLIYKKLKKKPIIPIIIEPLKILQDAFDNLNFDVGKSTIRSSSFPSLDSLSEVLLTSQDWKIDIDGHTDDKGSEEYNLKLSQNRANAVKEYLIKKGVLSDKITATGYGELKPIVENDSDINREKNRRVEFKITKPNNEVILTKTN